MTHAGPARAAAFVSAALSALADPEAGRQMAAYMKTTTPFHGVKKPQRVPIARELLARHRTADRGTWEATVLALWGLPHREERYMAIGYARAHRAHHVPASMPLFERLIREGAWWDLVDDVAANLVGAVWLRHRDELGPQMDDWIEDPDLWIRRTALLGQLTHREQTDAERLFAYCAAQLHGTDVFIRKAIGWALRQYADSEPAAVVEFLLTHREQMSGLSYREASRKLAAARLMA